MNDFSSEESTEETTEDLSEETTVQTTEESSEDGSEESSEESSEIVVNSEIEIPENVLSQLNDIHTLSVMGLAMFGTMFFLWVFDFLYKKLSHYF